MSTDDEQLEQYAKIVLEIGVGLQALENDLDTDEGTHFLGEIELVESGSPVEETGLFFRMALISEFGMDICKSGG